MNRKRRHNRWVWPVSIFLGWSGIVWAGWGGEAQATALSPVPSVVPPTWAVAATPQMARKVTSSILSPKSPAQQLFNEVNQLLREAYGGLSTVDRVKLAAEYQGRLNAVCAAAMNTCPVQKAYPVLEAQLTALQDEHSFFETPEDYSDFVTRATGGPRLQFGVKLAPLDGENRVVLEVVPESAADLAGLQRGDSFQTLDGQPYRYEALQAARQKGETITLGVLRQGQLRSLRLTPTSSSTLDLPRLSFVGPSSDIALLRIPTFLNTGVAQRVHDLVAEAKTRNARGLLVDLRGDTGGSLTECDLAVSAFVPEFARVARTSEGDARTVVRHGVRLDDVQRSASVREAQFWTGPLAVLVDEGSASCSEFFAFEVQQAGRGPVIGEQTAGVGNTATRVFRLSEGAALQLTITNYIKPDGKPYPTRVTPDIAFKVSEADTRQLIAGRDTLLEAALQALATAPTFADHE